MCDFFELFLLKKGDQKQKQKKTFFAHKKFKIIERFLFSFIKGEQKFIKLKVIKIKLKIKVKLMKANMINKMKKYQIFFYKTSHCIRLMNAHLLLVYK